MVLYFYYGSSVSTANTGREMATAESSTRPTNARNRRKAREVLASLMLREVPYRFETNQQRLKLAENALDAPVLSELWLVSPAWNAAILMLDCYGVIPADLEEGYMRTYGVSTLEEVAENMMRDGTWGDQVSKRAIELGAKSALHALNWARQKKTIKR